MERKVPEFMQYSKDISFIQISFSNSQQYYSSYKDFVGSFCYH